MKIATSIIAAILIAGSAGVSYAESDSTYAAEGVVAPHAARRLPNGEVAPAPVDRVDGGIGSQEVPYNNAQTRSGGPSGGNVTDNGG